MSETPETYETTPRGVSPERRIRSALTSLASEGGDLRAVDAIANAAQHLSLTAYLQARRLEALEADLEGLVQRSIDDGDLATLNRLLHGVPSLHGELRQLVDDYLAYREAERRG